MAGDIEVTMELNSARYDRGLRRAEQAAELTSRKIARQLGEALDFGKAVVFGKIGKEAFRIAEDAVRAFAKGNLEATMTLNRLNESVASVQKSLGQDLYYTLEGFHGELIAGLGVFEEWRHTAVNAVADVISSFPVPSGFMQMVPLGPATPFGTSTAAEIDAARAAEQESIRRGAEIKQSQGLQLEQQAALAEATGDSENAAFFREQIRHRNAKMTIGQGQDQGLKDRLLEAEMKLHDTILANIQKEKAAKKDLFEFELAATDAAAHRAMLRLLGLDREAAVRDAESPFDSQIARMNAEVGMPPDERARRVAALNRQRATAASVAGAMFDSEQAGKRFQEIGRLDADAARDRITQMQVRGYKTMAELAEIRLDAEQRIASIRESATLNAAEKEQYINGVIDNRERLLAATAVSGVDELEKRLAARIRGREFREVEAGLGGAIVGHWFGGGGKADDETQKIIEELEMINEGSERGLDRIGNLLERGLPAVAG